VAQSLLGCLTQIIAGAQALGAHCIDVAGCRGNKSNDRDGEMLL